ncbi:MAG: N-acetyltransferase family protein, partial [Acidobacteriota bacterium]|nr:N-acetyltransferase family protein [Acidobacteriota bacterium]
TEPVSVESRLDWFYEHNPQNRPLWVLETDGNDVGAWICLSSFYGRPAYQKTAEMSVYVDENLRGQGVGTRLAQAMIERCNQYNVTTIVGFVFAHNAPSLALTKKLGFEHWGFLPQVAELDGQKRDLVILGLHLANYKNS